MSGKEKSSTVYFDQNVYDFCADNIPAEDLQRILHEKNHKLVLGTLDLLEVASCFRSGKKQNIERGKFLSRYFESLLPIDMPLDISGLLLREVKKAVRQSYGYIYYEGTEKNDFEKEIRKLSRGVYDETASKFIEGDWEGKIVYRKQIEESLKKTVGIKIRNIRGMSFSNFMACHKVAYEAFRKQWIRSKLEARGENWHGYMLNSAIKRIANRPDRYPCFAVGPKIELFFFFKTGRDGTFSQDMLTDLKHFLSAVHMDIFVTGDHQLFNYAKDICPERTICKTDEYFKGYI